MTKTEAIKLFETKKVRTAWDDEHEKWFFSIVDVVAVLTDSEYQTARNYWKVLKNRLLKEGYQPVTNCNRLELHAADGKLRLTDVADTEQLSRISSRPYDQSRIGVEFLGRSLYNRTLKEKESQRIVCSFDGG